MKPIFELKGDIWLKGLSQQPDFAYGGLFKTATAFDPTERLGTMKPSLAATELTAPATSIKTFTHWNDGTTQYVYAHSNTKLYRYLRDSPYTQTDVTAQITTSDVFCGGIYWVGGSGDDARYVYSIKTTGDNASIRSNVFPVSSGSDVEILSGINDSRQDIVPFCIGADKKLYAGHFGAVASFANNDSAGTVTAFSIDRGHTVRAMVNDGRYLVIVADNNHPASGSRLVGNYSCRVYFWDMVAGTADVIWDFPGESYLISAEVLGDSIVVWGYSGVYITNSATKPKMILSFLGNTTVTKKPSHCYQTTSSPTAVYWGDGAANGQNIFAYGYLPGSSKRILYVPYLTHNSTYAHTAISFSAALLFAAVDSPKLYIHNTGSTRGTASLQTVPILLDQPYEYDYIKVTLRSKLSSGQSVTMAAHTADSTVISDTTTKSYSASNPRKDLVFKRTPASGSTSRFSDIYLTFSTAGGAEIAKISLYANPKDDDSQQL